MPLVKVTQEDVLRSLLVDTGWHPCRLHVTNVPFQAKWKISFEVIDGSMKGRGFTKTYVANGFLHPLFKALTGQDISVDLEYDPMSFDGKTCYVLVKHRTYEGRILAEPADYANISTPPF